VLNWKLLNAGREGYRRQWASAGSVPYILLEDFLQPGVCEQLADFSAIEPFRAAPVLRNHQHVHRKTVSGPAAWEVFTPIQSDFFKSVNAPEFLDFLMGVTGIEPMYADDELFGGGLHEIQNGGYLNIHTDFNHHPKTQKHRRLNLLVYLNPAWEDDWNGHIELWGEDISRPFLKERPLANRALLFETSEHSFHGHPMPLKMPNGMTRKSLATYYYSDFPPGLQPRHSTNYQLSRQQWAALMAKIADDAYAGLDEAAIVRKHNPHYQSRDIRRAYQALMGLRSAKIQAEPFWELPDGALTAERPEGAGGE
jgi:hypothetical protein